MKRFSRIISLFILVIALVAGLAGCATKPQAEVAAAQEAVETTAAAASQAPAQAVVEAEPAVGMTAAIKVQAEAALAEGVLPYGVKLIEKDSGGASEFSLYIVHTNDVHG
ncbi:MAG: 5'-nucleotidase C-terminal domain-containing protein, partial [Sphaerochaetaceae bacterium]